MEDGVPRLNDIDGAEAGTGMFRIARPRQSALGLDDRARP
jgi:hypothetical protein